MTTFHVECLARSRSESALRALGHANSDGRAGELCENKATEHAERSNQGDHMKSLSSKWACAALGLMVADRLLPALASAQGGGESARQLQVGFPLPPRLARGARGR